jgi:hypothetical protein
LRQRSLGFIVDARWPKIGARKSDTYTGDGFVTVRHPDINVVENALDFIDRTIKHHLQQLGSSQSKPAGKNDFTTIKELNRPAWDFEWEDHSDSTSTARVQSRDVSRSSGERFLRH